MGGFLDWFGGNSSSTSTQTKLNKLEKDFEAIKTTMSEKVDKEDGKGLSSNDFTDEYRDKLNSLSVNDNSADSTASGPVVEISTVTTEPIVAQVGNTDYVTPQMFGAYGTGWRDDADAIQAAIDSGKTVYFPHGEYMISKPLIITDKKFWSLNAQDAIITYTGNDYAIHILNATNLRMNIGMVYALQGGGIKFYSDSKTSWNQYNELTFNAIFAKTDCIHIETSGEGWSNENRVFGGHFAAGENGVNVVSRSIHTINGWKFYNCGIEGVNNGFMFDATEEEIGAICNMAIVNSRYAEDFETMLKTNGTVFDCLWIAPTYMTKNLIQCSPQTTRFEFYCPIGTFWHLHDTASHRGCVIDGVLMMEKPTYVEVK